jgi:hypothetical protein
MSGAPIEKPPRTNPEVSRPCHRGFKISISSNLTSTTNDFVKRGVGAGLDQRRQLRALRGAQLCPATAAMTVAQLGQTFPIVAMHPVAQRLAVHPAASRRACSILPFKNKRKRQNPPCRRSALLARCCSAKRRRRQILPLHDYRLAHRSGSRNRSPHRFTISPTRGIPRESFRLAAGIIPNMPEHRLRPLIEKFTELLSRSVTLTQSFGLA